MKWVLSISRDYWVYLDITLQSFKIWEFWGEFWGIETFYWGELSPATDVKEMCEMTVPFFFCICTIAFFYYMHALRLYLHAVDHFRFSPWSCLANLHLSRAAGVRSVSLTHTPPLSLAFRNLSSPPLPLSLSLSRERGLSLSLRVSLALTLMFACVYLYLYGVATISRLLKIVGLFCRISSL